MLRLLLSWQKNSAKEKPLSLSFPTQLKGISQLRFLRNKNQAVRQAAHSVF
jgi:hypothetical protein